MRKQDLKGEVNLFDYPSHLAYLHKINKGKMPYHGVHCFCGKQGSGKTLSAVRMINNILVDYPDTYVVSNVWLNFDLVNVIPENYIKLERYYQLFDNYDKPTIFLIDEAHLLFNSLESRNADVNMFTVISQQRKLQKIFVLTSQVFKRLQPVMREQVEYLINCRTFFNFFTFLQAYSDFEKVGDEQIGKHMFNSYFTHKKDIHYKMYDTKQVLDYSKDSIFWNTREMDIKKEGFEYGFNKRIYILHKEEHSSNNS